MMKRGVLLLILAAVAVAQADLIGLWEFNNAADLTGATIGPDLELIGSHAAAAGVDTGDGAARIGPGGYYTLTHGLAGNGGGANVNEWTLVYDIKCPRASKYSSLLQTSPANNNDGELFVKLNGAVGVGDTGYSPEDTVQANTWFRLVVRVACGSMYELWINGARVLNGRSYPVDGRYSLAPQVLLFADNDGEVATLDATQIALYNTTLSVQEIQNLGPAGQSLFHALNVYPALNSDGVPTTGLLEWKAPRDPNNQVNANPGTHSFVVYCDPNLVRLQAATYENHEDVLYYSDQLLTGDIADDPVQSFDPVPDLLIDTTYYWRVDTRLNDAEPNDVDEGIIWSFSTSIPVPANVVAHRDIVKPDETDGVITVTFDSFNDELSYQWYLDYDVNTSGDEVALSDGSDYSGVNTDTLTVISPAAGDPASGGDEGFYVCDVTNRGGTTRSTSARLVLGRLVNHYALEGDLTDSASGYNASLITGAAEPQWPAGHVGSYAVGLYDRQAAIVDLEQFPSSPYPVTSEFTITAWVYANSAAGWGSIVKHWNGGINGGMFHLGLDSSGTKLDLQIEQENGVCARISDQSTFPTGQWQFVAAVADGSSIRLYRMGADEATNRNFEIAATTYNGTLNYGITRWMAIGCKPAPEGSGADPGADTGVAGFWNGMLDDIQIYNYGLNAEEVAGIFGASVCLYSNNPADSRYLNTRLDFNADCKVDLGDFMELASHWLTTGLYTPAQ
ncbi:MAG: LamG domain-containing protein [Anaerohalosphaeraceae bacterium]